MHGRRGEAGGLPIFQIPVYLLRPPVKNLFILKQPSVVSESMHADFKTIAPQKLFDVFVVGVAFGNKIKGRPKSEFHLQPGKVENPFLSLVIIHVVRQHEGELLAAGPAFPPGGWCGSFRIDGPDVGVFSPFVSGDLAAQGDLQGPWNKGLQCIEEAVSSAIKVLSQFTTRFA